MKNKIIIIILLSLIGTGLFAEVRLLGYIESDVKEQEYEESFIDRIDSKNPIYGMIWEVIFNNIGLGGHYGVYFDKIYDYGTTEEWTMDWKGDLFISYHLFGEKTFLDPFAEIGIGNAGIVKFKVDENSEENYTNEEESGEVTNMSMYTYASLGLAMNINDIILGAKINYINGSIEVPATSFNKYPTENVTFTIFTGYSF